MCVMREKENCMNEGDTPGIPLFPVVEKLFRFVMCYMLRTNERASVGGPHILEPRVIWPGRDAVLGGDSSR